MDELCMNWERIAEHAQGPIVVVNFGGRYPPGSEGAESAYGMIDFVRSVLAETKPAAVHFDLTALDYVCGNTIVGIAMPLFEKGKGFRPSAIVATGRTARALRPLLKPKVLLGMAGMQLFDTRQKVLKHLNTMLMETTG